MQTDRPSELATTNRFRLLLALSAVTLVGAASSGLAAEARIAMSPGVPISALEAGSRHLESVLAVNPRDPDNLIAAAILFGARRSGIAIYFSRDRGRSWKQAARSSDPGALFDGLDPAIVFDAGGKAFFLSMADGGLPVWASTDGGEHWTGPTVIRGSWDRPWIGAFDSGNLLVIGKLPITILGHAARDVIGVTKSRDQGATFGFPSLLLPAPEKHLLNVVSDLLVGSGDQALMVLQLFGAENLGRQGRQPLSGSYATVALGAGVPPELRPGPEFRLFGHAWEGKSAFGYGFARVAIDASASPWRGRLYMTFLDVADGYHRVMASTSTDAGRTWSTPLRVSDTLSPTDASNPAIAVNGEGVVGVVWNDRRGDPTDRCFQLYFAASLDGGATFSANRRVDDRFTCPIGPPPVAGGTRVTADPTSDPIESEARYKNGGDTQGLVGLPDAFSIAWINGGSGVMDLWSTTVKVETSAPAPRSADSRESTLRSFPPEGGREP